MRKKKLALAYELNEERVLEFINKLQELKTTVTFDNILLFSNSLTEESKNKINEIYPCIFIKTGKLIKAKFKVFDYLNDFKTIVFSNLNIDLSDELINQYKDKCYSVKMHINDMFVEANFKKLLTKYNMFTPAQDLELLIITDKIKNYKMISKWCYKKLITLHFNMRNSVNGVLDIMLQRFKIPVTIINKEKECYDSLQKYDYSMLKVKNKIQLKKEPLVTILISIYERTEYLDEALQSLLKQSYSNFEILIILEYSTKQSEIDKKISSYNDKRIRIIKNKEKLGLAESLNIGIKLSKGKYIARMDDDDVSCFDRIEKQVEYLENHLDISVVGSFMQFFENSSLICELPTDNEILKVKCLYKTPLFHPTIMFRVDDFRVNKFEYKSDVYAEDYELWSRIISKLKIANIPEVLYYYRLGNENKSLQDENAINNSHHNIMKYQLKHYLDLNLTFDELQLLSGRVDVLGNSVNLLQVYKLKLRIWNKILKANKKRKFYLEKYILDEIEEIKTYYFILKEQR